MKILIRHAKRLKGLDGQTTFPAPGRAVITILLTRPRKMLYDISNECTGKEQNDGNSLRQRSE